MPWRPLSQGAFPGSPLPQLVVADPLAALRAIARENRRAFQGKGRRGHRKRWQDVHQGTPFPRARRRGRRRPRHRGQPQQSHRRRPDPMQARCRKAPLCGGRGRDQRAGRDGGPRWDDRARCHDRDTHRRRAPRRTGRPRRASPARRRSSPSPGRQARSAGSFPRNASPTPHFARFPPTRPSSSGSRPGGQARAGLLHGVARRRPHKGHRAPRGGLDGSGRRAHDRGHGVQRGPSGLRCHHFWRPGAGRPAPGLAQWRPSPR